jgi:iron complex outermembrane receptor protein
MNRFYWLVICFVHTVVVSGQDRKGISDTVFQIPEVSITVNRMDNFSTGNKVQRIDSALLKAYSAANLSQTLSACTGVQINSYGTGLSSASLRGTGSSHTAVIWNGFNIQDILNGGVDFSLIPSGFFDNIKVQYGGNGALFGSGCIGGAIHLDNSLDFNKGVKASFRSAYGSYRHYYEGLNISFSNRLFSGFVKTYVNAAKNDFQFKNTEEFGSPVQTMHNAEVKEAGVIAGAALKLKEHQRLETNFWYLNNDKNIAPTLNSLILSNNRNQSYRTSAAWKYWRNQINVSVRSGFFNNFLLYTPQSSNLEKGKHQALSLVNEAELTYKYSENHLVNFGLNYTIENGISNDLTNDPQRNRFSAFASYRFISNNSKWHVVSSFREEMMNKMMTPLTFTLGMERQINKLIQVKGKISRNFRVPSLNDLYWKGWGNPDLKSESGLGQDLEFIVAKTESSVTFQYELSAFTNIVKDWIVWHPNTGNTWTPDNISRVWARGVEQDLSFQFELSDVIVKPSISYSFTRSTKIVADFPGDDAYHKQLTYVPLHKAGLKTLVKVDGFQLFYVQNFMGRRYTLADNSKYVDPVFVGDFSLSKTAVIGSQLLVLSLFINNVWNSAYQVIQYYPCPLRNYQFSIQLNFK